MQAVSSLVKDTLADYIKNLPIPDSFLGWLSLSVGDWLRLAPFVGVVGALGYLAYRRMFPCHVLNPCIGKDNCKVIDIVDIEDIQSEKVCYCRCWRSKKFPLCDGSHTKHNKQTGDNVGPLLLRKSKKPT